MQNLHLYYTIAQVEIFILLHKICLNFVKINNILFYSNMLAYIRRDLKTINKNILENKRFKTAL